MLDEEDLSYNARASIKELPKMEAKLKSAQDNLAKIKSTKVDDKTEIDTTPPGSKDKAPEVSDYPKDVAVETPKDTVVKSFVKPPEESVIELPKDPTEVNSAPKDTNVSFVKPINETEIPKDYTVNTFVPPVEQEMPKMIDNEYDFVQSEQTFVEPEYVQTANDIAKFDNIDSISEKTDKEKDVKSEVIKKLEESLTNTKESLKSAKEEYSKYKNVIDNMFAKKEQLKTESGDVSKLSKSEKDSFFDKLNTLNTSTCYFTKTYI